MSWIMTYAASSAALILLVVSIEPRLRPEWREALLWFSLLVPMLVATIDVITSGPPGSAGFTSLVAPISVPLRTAIRVTPRSTIDVGLIAALVWISVALVMVLRDVTIHRRLVRALDRKPVASRNLLGIASRLGIHNKVVLTASRTLPVPIAIGPAEICLPASLLEIANQNDLDPIIAHELAHLRRRDPQLQQIARLISIVFWWQPLNRIVARKLSAVAELRADALCSTVVVPVRLARTLVQFAQRAQSAQMTGMPAFPSGLLTERVSALLSENRNSSSRQMRVIVSVVLTLATFSVAPRFAILRAQLPLMFQPLIIKASLITPVRAVEPPKKPTVISPRSATTVEPRDEDVIAALANLLNDPNKQVRFAARESLRKIGTPASINALGADRFAETDAMKEIR